VSVPGAEATDEQILACMPHGNYFFVDSL
jgi:hypothetical protein